MHKLDARAPAAAATLLVTGIIALASGCERRQPPASGSDTVTAAHDKAPGTSVASVPEAAARNQVVARAGAEVITTGDLDAAIAGVAGAERLEYATPAPLRELVESLAEQRLMAAAATGIGLDKDPAVKAQLDAAGPSDRARILADAYIARELAKAPVPTEQDIAHYYRGHPAEFAVPARMEVSRVVAATAAAAERTRAALAKGASPDAIRNNDPDHTLQADRVWLQDNAKKGEIETIAFALKPGEVSRVFHTEAGFAVLRAEDKAPGRTRPLAEVRAGIRARLDEEQRQAVVAAIRSAVRKDVTVTIDEPALSSYLSAARPSA